MLAFRRVSHPTNRRSFVFTVLPTKVAANDKAQLLFPACDDHLGACLLAIFNSLVLEFVGHLKQASTNLGLYILKQLPVLPPEAFTPQDVDFICERVAKLTRNADDINAVWLTDYPTYTFQEPQERLRIQSELDAYIARMYGLTRDELRYILDPKDLMGDDFPSETFTVLKKNEKKRYGDYLTWHLVLDAFDALEAGTLKA